MGGPGLAASGSCPPPQAHGQGPANRQRRRPVRRRGPAGSGTGPARPALRGGIGLVGRRGLAGQPRAVDSELGTLPFCDSGVAIEGLMPLSPRSESAAVATSLGQQSAAVSPLWLRRPTAVAAKLTKRLALHAHTWPTTTTAVISIIIPVDNLTHACPLFPMLPGRSVIAPAPMPHNTTGRTAIH